MNRAVHSFTPKCSSKTLTLSPSAKDVQRDLSIREERINRTNQIRFDFEGSIDGPAIADVPQVYWDDLFDRALEVLNSLPLDGDLYVLKKIQEP